MTESRDRHDWDSLVNQALEQDASRAVGSTDLWPRLYGAVIARRRRGRVRGMLWGEGAPAVARIAALGSLAAVAAVVVAVAQPFGGSPNPLYAAWTPQPGVVEPGLEREFDRLCGPAEDLGRSEFLDMTWGPRPPLAVMDQRGDVALAIYAGESIPGQHIVYSCTIVRYAEIDGGRWRSTAGALALMKPGGPAPVTIEGIGACRTGKGVFRCDHSYVAGRVTGDASRVLVRLRDKGVTVEAKRDGGYFLAFWPEWTEDLAVHVEAYDADGDLLGMDYFPKGDRDGNILDQDGDIIGRHEQR